MKRRRFIKTAALAGAASTLPLACSPNPQASNSPFEPVLPVAISTWWHGLKANEKGWEILSKGGTALDAVEQGVMVVEADPEGLSVGIGGLPDRDGNVTLDACIMDHNSNCGAVLFLKNIMHPIAVARKVMEETPHVILAGEGALEFALSQGFVKENLLTEKAKKAWEAWKVKSQYKPIINIENHDTIGMIALDKMGNLAGSCTTSGLAYKMHGRVGDSPIIGAGLYVDNEIGAAVATGLGEEIIKTVGSFLVVELMRQGASPQEACEESIHRITRKYKDKMDFQAAFIALNKNGESGGHAIHKGFGYARCDARGNEVTESTWG